MVRIDAGADLRLSNGIAADPRHMANLIVNCWEGVALRSRLCRDPAPLDSMLDFYFSAVAAAPKSEFNTAAD